MEERNGACGSDLNAQQQDDEMNADSPSDAQKKTYQKYNDPFKGKPATSSGKSFFNYVKDSAHDNRLIVGKNYSEEEKILPSSQPFTTIGLVERTCSICNKICSSKAGKANHMRSCIKKGKQHQNSSSKSGNSKEVISLQLEEKLSTDTEPHLTSAGEPSSTPKEAFYWGETQGSIAIDEINECYEKIVFWRRNLFLLPKGSSGKDYLREVTRLCNAWSENTPLRECSWKAIHIMPALLLQKPSKTSKSKDHVNALQRRLKLWEKGEFVTLLHEAEALQKRLPKVTSKRDTDTLSRMFKEQMQKGNINTAIKLMTNNMEGGILPINDETLDLLRTKHPRGKEVNENFLLQGPLPKIDSIIFEVIDESMVLKAAQLTRGGSGPSGMDADGWRRILTSKDYGENGTDLRIALARVIDLRIALARVIRKMCTEIKDDSLGPLLASRLIPLDKRLDLRPIGVGEFLRKIMGKVVMSVVKPDIIAGSSRAQMCGHNSGSEAAIHAMKRMFDVREKRK